MAVGGVVGAFLLNINAVLSNVRNLPSEVGKTTSQFSSWYYEDTEWSGYWTNNPQVYVDAADMNLSAEKFVIDIKVENGVIDGTIATPQICGATPFYDFFLLRGQVSKFGDTATVVVWDTFQGHDEDIAMLELQRDGVVMSVVPKEGNVQLFPKTARIAVDPSVKSAPEFCEGKREAMMKALERVWKEQRQSLGVSPPSWQRCALTRGRWP